MVGPMFAGFALDQALSNLQAEGRQYEREYQQWLKYQEYNSPANQIARLESAGLNPNLIYGSSSVGSSTVSVPHRGSDSGNNAQVATNFLANMISMIEQVRNGRAQRELMQAQKEQLESKTENNVERTAGQILENIGTQIENKYRQHALEYYEDHNTVKGANNVNSTVDRLEQVYRPAIESVATKAGEATYQAQKKWHKMPTWLKKYVASTVHATSPAGLFNYLGRKVFR